MGMYGDESKVGVECGVGRTKQGFARGCNINTLVERYKKTGLFTSLNSRPPFYGDVSELKGYQESLNVVLKARELFEGLPGKIKARFSNDPGALVAFLEDKGNMQEAIALGICEARKPPADSEAPDEVSGSSKPVGGKPEATPSK